MEAPKEIWCTCTIYTLNIHMHIHVYIQGVVEAPKELADGEEAPEDFAAEKLEAALKVCMCMHCV